MWPKFLPSKGCFFNRLKFILQQSNSLVVCNDYSSKQSRMNIASRGLFYGTSILPSFLSCHGHSSFHQLLKQHPRLTYLKLHSLCSAVAYEETSKCQKLTHDSEIVHTCSGCRITEIWRYVMSTTKLWIQIVQFKFFFVFFKWKFAA